MANIPDRQIPGVYHRRIGDVVVTAVSDGYLHGSLTVLNNIDEPDAQALIDANYGPETGRLTSVNTFLVHSAGRVALIDTGCGTYMGPTGGRLLSNLEAAGIAPGEIDTVLLTHMHPDHSAGLTDRDTGKPFFANAELVMHENEMPHWRDDTAMARATDREKALYFECSREQTDPYLEGMRTFAGEGEVFPDLIAMPANGHTPGHTMYQVQSGGEQLLIWGDIVHAPEVQTRHPEVTIDFDTDKEKAIETRRRVFDMVATDGLLIAGMHLHYPAFSHLVRDGDGYRVIPERWQQTL